jgi:hypothetical protein
MLETMEVGLKMTNGLRFSTDLLEWIERYGLKIKFLEGQGYDGALVMRDKLNGVRVHVRQKQPLAELHTLYI